MGSDLLLFVLLRLIRIQFGSRMRYGAIRILKSCLRPLSSRWLDFRPFKTSTTHFCDWTIQSLFNLPIFIIFLFGVSFFLLLFPILYFNTIKIIIEIIFILSGKVPTFVTFLAAFFSLIF